MFVYVLSYSKKKKGWCDPIGVFETVGDIMIAAKEVLLEDDVKLKKINDTLADLKKEGKVEYSPGKYLSAFKVNFFTKDEVKKSPEKIKKVTSSKVVVSPKMTTKAKAKVTSTKVVAKKTSSKKASSEKLSSPKESAKLTKKDSESAVWVNPPAEALALARKAFSKMPGGGLIKPSIRKIPKKDDYMVRFGSSTFADVKKILQGL
jgi:hypothetical protein